MALALRVRWAAGGRLRPPTPARWQHAAGAAGVLAELRARGCVHGVTDDAGLAAVMAAPGAAVYCGFDPTAATLHVGNLAAVLTLVRFALAGHPVVALVGGATGLVGDPSGRSEDRPATTAQAVARNAEGIAATLRRLLANALAMRETATEGAVEAGASPWSALPSPMPSPAPGAVTMVNNMDWYGAMSAVDFVREAGGHFRLGSMLGKEAVKARLASPQGISFPEFTYQIFQAYDFLHLFRHHHVRVQVGGSDQWGNITAGTDLIRRAMGASAADGALAHGLTVPLVTTAAGAKFGKSMGNAVWLDETRTSAYALHQFFLNTADADVAKLLGLLTLLPRARVAAILAAHALNPDARGAQRALADHVCMPV